MRMELLAGGLLATSSWGTSSPMTSPLPCCFSVAEPTASRGRLGRLSSVLASCIGSLSSASVDMSLLLCHLIPNNCARSSSTSRSIASLVVVSLTMPSSEYSSSDEIDEADAKDSSKSHERWLSPIVVESTLSFTSS